MKPCLIVVSVLFQLLAVSALADLRVDDPKGILAQVDAFLGQTGFQSTFQAGDTVLQEWHGCAPVSDGSVECGPAAEAHTEVVSVSPAEAVYRSQVADQPATDVTVTRAEFEAAHGNYLRLYVKTLSGNGGEGTDSISLDSATPADATLRDGRQIRAIKIRLTIHSATQFPMTLTIGRGVPFIAQALELNLFPDQTDIPGLRVVSLNR